MRSSACRRGGPVRGMMHAERRTLARCGLHLGATAVRLGDRGDDREAEARRRRSHACATGRSARTVRTRAPRLRRLMPGPSSATSITASSPSLARRGRRTGVSRRRVRARVLEQVREHLAEPVLVAGDDDRAGRSRRATGRSGDVTRRSSTAARDEPGEVDRAAFERPALIEPREQQQVVDEHAHARRLFLDAAHRLREVVGPVGSRRAGTARRSRGST